jgi:hypothetical protein
MYVWGLFYLEWCLWPLWFWNHDVKFWEAYVGVPTSIPGRTMMLITHRSFQYMNVVSH